jgi:hypothetical protein
MAEVKVDLMAALKVVQLDIPLAEWWAVTKVAH